MGVGFPGRVAASLLQAIGLEEMIATSLDGYETMALRLAHDGPALEAARTKLARNRGHYPLFDTPRFTRNLERAYVSMWERSQRGLAPESFAIGREP